ncbi:MAG: NAD(P)-dependent oxidoreductase [Hyphomicrobiales bacterium]|nr:NAD(P)-dependent oxidoreductase [Hyphomicrobiales bacterium]
MMEPKRIGIVAPGSVLGGALAEYLNGRFEVTSIGRRGALLSFDLASVRPIEASVAALDVIVNCGASFGGQDPSGWRDAILTNVLGAVNVLELARRSGACHIVNISSVSAMPENADRDASGYGLSKLQAEAWLTWAADRAKGVTNLRLGPFYTDDETGARHQPFLYAVMKKAVAGSEFILYGNNDPARNYLHIQDVVRAIERVISIRATGCFAIVAPRCYRTTRVIELAYATFGRMAQIRRDPSRPDLPEIVWPNPTASFAALGWCPSINLKEGLERVRSRLLGGSA